jgi:hypothetical protein
MGDIDILGGVETIEIGELYARAYIEIELRVLDAVVQREPVGSGKEFIGIAEEAVEGGETLHGINVIVGIVGGSAFVVSIIIVQLDDLVLADGFGIGEGRAERAGMKGVGIVLIEDLCAIQFEEIIHGIIIPLSAVVIDGPVEVDGKSPVRFFEFMTEGEIGAVDIEAALGAGGVAVGAADRGIVLVRG